MSEPIGKLSEQELDRLVRNFDHHSAEYRDHSVQILDRMQKTCPFAHSPKHGGFWVATKADAVLEIARNATAFSNFPAEVIPALEPTLMIPLNVDPPLLYDYRTVLNPLFSPKRVQAEAAEIRATAQRLMEVLDVGAATEAPVERFAFYERAKNAYCVIATGEARGYGCFIFKKGVQLAPDAPEAAHGGTR